MQAVTLYLAVMLTWANAAVIALSLAVIATRIA